ncbi:MAG: HAMP domain-containing histidine kinase [Clostridia bacterium]|nr:HAMP domain-containing histidine kinase [Clostridia bacterium]
MINKLRKKIFWIIQISLSIIILGIIVLYSTSSYKNTITSSTMFMERIEVKNEIKENIKVDKPTDFKESNTIFNPFLADIEGVYRLEIKDNEVIRESNDTTEEVRKYAIEISNKNSEEGYIGNYIYKVRKFGNNGKEITLMENEDAIKRLKTTVISAVIIGFVGIIIISLIAKKIAEIIVKPVEESFEKQKQFVSDASHELKTPLAVIEANADVLQDKIGEDKWLTYIQKEVQSMNKLVNDLLSLARMENTKETNYPKFNLSKEVQMAVAVFESMIYEKEIKLETNISEGINFEGDREDIKHLISIILDNAIKHTEKDNKIIVEFEKEKNDIKIEIKNQGEPIPVEEQEKIFERFYRVDKARNRNEKRYGLGLSIAKEIVNKYNGTIKASSKDGFTTFVVKL